jgi:hypothetical protein
MKSQDTRIAVLEQKLARLERELARVNASNAKAFRRRQGSWICKPDQDIAQGDTDTVSLYANEEDTTLNEECKALGAEVKSGLWCIAWIDQSGKWYVGPWEPDC